MDDFSLTVTGLVTRVVDVGEYDRLLTVLTHEYGKMTVTVKGGRSQKCKHISSAQLFSYSTFVLKRYKKRLYISDTETKESFFGLCGNLEALALATYLVDICTEMTVEHDEDEPVENHEEDILRLTLNALYALANNKDTPQKIKAVYELKACALSGICPDLVGCSHCGKFENTDMYLELNDGILFCPKCKPGDETEAQLNNETRAYFHMSQAVLEAMRHIAYADQKRMLAFSLDGKSLDELSEVCEKFLISQMEHDFHSLRYYKKICSV